MTAALARSALVAGAIALTLSVFSAAHGAGELAYDFQQSYLPAAQAIADGETIYDAGYWYPPLLAELTLPMLLLPETVAGWLASIGSLAAFLAALVLVGVRDVRVLAVAAVSTPVLLGAQVANGTALVALLVALSWRAGALAAGAAIAVKLVVWPLAFWLWVTEGRRALAVCVASALGFVLIPWALIGFDELGSYWSHATANAESQSGVTYAISTSGLPGGRVLAAALTMLLLAGCWWQRADRARSFAFAIAAALAATPVLWGFYFTLVMVALALQRPRLSPVWFSFLVLWITPGTSWPFEWWSKLVGLALTLCMLAWLGVGAPRDPAAWVLRGRVLVGRIAGSRLTRRYGHS